jgi:Zn-dependent alcohol dehydrogenase
MPVAAELTTRAAVLHEVGAPLAIEEVAVEAPHSDEVLIRIQASGVCHSDLSVVRGEFKTPLPAVLGHEGAGVVESVGTGVTNVVPGDHVLILFRAACRNCQMCAVGRPALCAQGARLRQDGTLVDGTTRLRLGHEPVYHFSGASTFAQLAVVPAVAVVPVPKQLPLSRLALIGCAVMTGVGAVFNAAELKPGTAAVVIGCGGVGLSAVQACAIAGAATIIAADLSEPRLQRARELGATHTVCVPEHDLVDEARILTDGVGVDYAFETAGTVGTLELAMAVIRPGGTAVAVGVPALGKQIAFDVAPFVVGEKVLKGCLYGSANFQRDIPHLLALYESGRLDLDAMVGREVRLDEVNEALNGLEHEALARTIIRM